MDDNLLSKLKLVVKQILDKNTRFHCYGHAIEVLNNVKKLIDVEQIKDLDEVSLYTASLFHDVSNSSDNEVEGKEGGEIAERILLTMEEFPRQKIPEVKRLIESINEKEVLKIDEVILNTADEMSAFSSLGLCRSLMISGGKGLKVKEALEWELSYLEKRFSNFKLESAKKLVGHQYSERRKFILDCLGSYRN